MIRSFQESAVGRATIGDALRRQALRDPSKAALVVHTPGRETRTLSYRELNTLATDFAEALLALGIRTGDCVAALASNCPEYLIAYLGALKIGAPFTGVNERFLPDEVEWQLRHADARVLIVDASRAHVAQACATNIESLSLVVIGDTSDGTAWPRFHDLLRLHADAAEPDCPVTEDSVALLSYTSGTEARPKGILIPHRNYLISTMPSMLMDEYVTPHDRYLFIKPFYSIAGVGSITSLLLVGATVVLLTPVTPDGALDAIEKHRITTIAQTPTFYAALTSSLLFGSTDLSTLRKCESYGGPIPRNTLDRFRLRAPHVTWANYWGQSELTQLGTIGWFRDFADIPDGDPRWIGRPTAGLEVRVVDEQGQPTEVGELICRSPSLMLGYHKDPARTAAVVQDGWLHTGDIVRIDGRGNLFFMDRTKDVIKSGGLNVSSLEVEATLLTHPGILEAAVVGLPDEYWSEAVTAFVVPRSGIDLSVEDVSSFCRQRLAHYKVPKRIMIVEALPRDPQGKLLKRRLREVGALDSSAS